LSNSPQSTTVLAAHIFFKPAEQMRATPEANRVICPTGGGRGPAGIRRLAGREAKTSHFALSLSGVV
jgi:hypothetical protein